MERAPSVYESNFMFTCFEIVKTLMGTEKKEEVDWGNKKTSCFSLF